MSDPRHLTVKAFAETIGKPAGWPSVSTLRRLIHYDTDGFRAACLRRIGARILIDVEGWHRWMDARRVKAPRRAVSPEHNAAA